MVINDPDTLKTLRACFDAYEIALGTNDIAALDGWFWPSEFTLRYGVGENLYGYEAIARFRIERPGGSPERVLANTVIVTYGDSFGTANTEFRRVGGGPLGRQSQTWVRFAQGWRIVAAHVSLMAEGH